MRVGNLKHSEYNRARIVKNCLRLGESVTRLLFCSERFSAFLGIVRQQSPNPFFYILLVNFEARSINAFVQHLAVRLIGNGYVFYVLGEIPKEKDPTRLDHKFAERYGVGESKWSQFRRKRRGEAKVKYLRFGRTFVLVATAGKHPFFLEEREALKDARYEPIRCFGYEIKCVESSGRFIPAVRLPADRFDEIRGHVFQNPCADEEYIRAVILSEQLLWFSGVKRQIFRLLTELNEKRKRRECPGVYLPRETLGNKTLTVFNTSKISRRGRR